MNYYKIKEENDGIFSLILESIEITKEEFENSKDFNKNGGFGYFQAEHAEDIFKICNNKESALEEPGISIFSMITLPYKVSYLELEEEIDLKGKFIYYVPRVKKDTAKKMDNTNKYEIICDDSAAPDGYKDFLINLKTGNILAIRDVILDDYDGEVDLTGYQEKREDGYNEYEKYYFPSGDNPLSASFLGIEPEYERLLSFENDEDAINYFKENRE